MPDARSLITRTTDMAIDKATYAQRFTTPHTLDRSWFTISRFWPDSPRSQVDLAGLLELLSHPAWEVRWNAARELYIRRDKRAIDALTGVLTSDPVPSVRLMASQALGALHEKGILVPLYDRAEATPDEQRIQVALARLAELGVVVTITHTSYRLAIPQTLLSPLYIEIGYLMAQLDESAFPQDYSPLADVPSLVLPMLSHPAAEFRESYPSHLKYIITRQHPESDYASVHEKRLGMDKRSGIWEKIASFGRRRV